MRSIFAAISALLLVCCSPIWIEASASPVASRFALTVGRRMEQVRQNPILSLRSGAAAAKKKVMTARQMELFKYVVLLLE